MPPLSSPGGGAEAITMDTLLGRTTTVIAAAQEWDSFDAFTASGNLEIFDPGTGKDRIRFLRAGLYQIDELTFGPIPEVTLVNGLAGTLASNYTMRDTLANVVLPDSDGFIGRPDLTAKPNLTAFPPPTTAKIIPLRNTRYYIGVGVGYTITGAISQQISTPAIPQIATSLVIVRLQ